jgi:hypothetical protein
MSGLSPGLTQLPSQWVLGVLSLGIVSRVWSWPPPFSTKLKNERSYTSPLPVCLHGVDRTTPPFQFLLTINLSYELAVDLLSRSVQLFTYTTALVFVSEHYCHQALLWTIQTQINTAHMSIGVWSPRFFANAQIILFCKTAPYTQKNHGYILISLQMSSHCPSTNSGQQSITYWQNSILKEALLLLYRLFCSRCTNFRMSLNHFE